VDLAVSSDFQMFADTHLHALSAPDARI